MWKDVSVSFDAENNFVVTCSNGAYLLVDMQYRAVLEKEIKKFCDNRVVFVKSDKLSEGEIDRQLQGLGEDVKFENNKK